jgi:hypothetical protein
MRLRPATFRFSLQELMIGVALISVLLVGLPTFGPFALGGCS